MGTDWIVTPIVMTGSLNSNKVVIFEKGVTVVAKKGEFHRAEPLFRLENVSNISLIGYGATFKMQKADYMDPALYGFSEARSCISIFAGATGIKIMGLILRDSGGDGVVIYFPPTPSNILIKDVICDNNYRQGISPCDFKNLTIENSVMINTSGALYGPWAGIDFEPDAATMFMQNAKINNCYFANNNGGGILFALWYTAAPVSIDIRHCFISSKNFNAVTLLRTAENGVQGTASFDDCIIENSGLGGLELEGKPANTYLGKFTNCLWQNCNPAINFELASDAKILGNLQFINSTINEPDYQLTIKRTGALGLANITGNLKINGPYGISSASLGTGTNVTLQITEGSKSKPPVVASVKPDKGIPDKVTHYNAGDAINMSAVAYDPDIGTTNGAGISKVDFALWRGDVAVASYSDVSAPYAWPVTISSKCPRGIYLIRITAYSQDGSYTVAVVPIYIYNTIDGTGSHVIGTGINLNHETYNIIPGNDFLVRNTSQGFMVYSPYATDGRITITDLSGRKVTLEQTVKSKSWNNISTSNKLSNNVYFIQTIDEKGSNSIVMIAK
jgi:hypothetical protein